jgi:transposase
MDTAAEVQRLQEEIHQLKSQLAEKDTRIEHLTEELILARHRQFGRKSERLSTQELFGFDEMPYGIADIPAEDIQTVDVPAHVRKLKKGRTALPAHLERRDIIHDLDENQKICSCGCRMSRIGQEQSEKLAIIPAQVYVERHIRPKYACSTCSKETEKTHVILAPVPQTIIPRSIATAELLATIFLHKFEDHLPYYRQEKQFERLGIEISRQDMSNWTIAVARFLEDLINLMKTQLISFPVINMDETSVQVLGEVGKDDTSLSYMWLARGGPPGKSIILYTYSRSRSRDTIQKIIPGYTGHLQADEYSGYESAEKDSAFTLIGCWAHVRRKFDEAAKAGKKASSAREALSQIARLYAIESQLRIQLSSGEITADEFARIRNKQSQPVLDKFHTWLMKKNNTVLPSSAAGKAVGYTVKQWPKLIRYLDHPDCTPDNNAAERAIRPFVLGRKNWLFSGSPVGAMASCTLYSLIQTAKENGLNTREYLTNLLTRAPKTPKDQWMQFLPFCSEP